MKVSFVVIAYNEERSIAGTLRAILAQADLPTHEIIVVNDGSKDQTLPVVQDLAVQFPAIKIVDLQPNQGRGAARDAGIKAAQGEYIAFVDADIILPANWLRRCMPYMQTYDVCGGTAVPDGDVSLVHRLCRLQPKVAAHTTTVTGSNGLFRASVFEKVSFNPKKRNGEDVALGYQINKHSIRTLTVPGLVVDHREIKSYSESLAWLFESGIGASRQLYEHKEVRMPDIASFGFMGITALAVIATILQPPLWPLALLVILGYVTASSLMHLHGKFHLAAQPLQSGKALAINNTLLVAYYFGRLAGLVTQWRNR